MGAIAFRRAGIAPMGRSYVGRTSVGAGQVATWPAIEQRLRDRAKHLILVERSRSRR